MTNFNFGLPPSVIDTVKNIIEARKMKEVCPKCGKSPCKCEEMDEELKGNQKKLDKNHNGKLDAQDFKMLRKEEVEQIDEISVEKAAEYSEKAYKDYKTKKNTSLVDKETAKKWGRDIANRAKGMERAQKIFIKANEEVTLSAEELARIEEINNNLDEVVTARKLTPADKKARAEYLAKHAEKLKQHETGIESPKKSFKDVNTERGDYTHQPSKMGIKHSIGSGYYKND